MRKAPVAVLLAALAVGAVACGGGDEPEPSAGQSGNAPIPETTEATTTTTEVTTTTLPEMVVDIPDVSELGLEWDETPTIDPVSGEIAMGPFNEFLLDEAPNTMLPEGTLDDLAGDELEETVEEGTASAPFKTVAVFLGLEPDEADTQMLRLASGGPEGYRVVVIQSSLEDDSVRAVRWEFAIQLQPRDELLPQETTTTAAEAAGDTTTSAVEDTATTVATDVPQDLVPVVYTALQTFQCQPDRGHQDFTAELCV